MKRKFSFNLPPVKVALRSDVGAKPVPESVSSSSPFAHYKPFSKESVSPPSSPYISRRVLDASTERELRAACKLILKNFKPSDADLPDTDPKLDFSGPHRRKDHRSDPSHAEVRTHKATAAPQQPKSPHDAKKPVRKEEYAVKAYPDLPMLANTGRRRDGHTTERDGERGRSVRSPTHDAARAQRTRHDVDSDDAKSLSTPLTASTDAHINFGSTAPTSVASHRGSRQYESAAAIADAQAAEWMRQELEKRRQNEAANPHPEPPPSAHRLPSRAGSIRAGIKDYIFPGSRSLTGSQSRESIRGTDSHSSCQVRRSGSATGWRSWGLNRMTSSRSSSRPPTSGSRTVRSEQDKKVEVDLNRKLPPLPSLDTWKDLEAKDKEKKPPQTSSAHIANLMRTQDQQQQEFAAAVRRRRRSRSESMASQSANLHAQSTSARIPCPAHSTSSHKPVHKSAHASTDLDHMMSAMASSRNLDDHLQLHVGECAPQRSMSFSSRPPSTSAGIDGRHQAPNFSRKISAEVSRSSETMTTQDAAYIRAVQLSEHAKENDKEAQKRTLRKVISGWMSKKAKKDDWMGQVEKRGIKNGIMTQDEAALPPVVRY